MATDVSLMMRIDPTAFQTAAQPDQNVESLGDNFGVAVLQGPEARGANPANANPEMSKHCSFQADQQLVFLNQIQDMQAALPQEEVTPSIFGECLGRACDAMSQAVANQHVAPRPEVIAANQPKQPQPEPVIQKEWTPTLTPPSGMTGMST